jgi:dethiobiotin synthetase
VSRGFLVTGTDTGIGKTMVGCALAAALSCRVRVGVLKPAETGCAEERGELRPDDALRLRAAAGGAFDLRLVCPFRYAEPLAPWLAAERAGRPISLERIEECFAALSEASDVVLVEGAGGLLVPLTERESFADLAARLSLALVVVIVSRLGALNQTLLTLECARRRGLAVAGYVWNHLSAERDLSQRLNGEALARLTEVPCIGELPFLPQAASLERDELAALGEPLAERLVGPAPKSAK